MTSIHKSPMNRSQYFTRCSNALLRYHFCDNIRVFSKWQSGNLINAARNSLITSKIHDVPHVNDHMESCHRKLISFPVKQKAI